MPGVNLRPRKRGDKGPSKEMPFDVALRKFRKAVDEAGTLQKLREKEFYEKPTAKRKRKKKEAKSRWLKEKRSMELSSPRHGRSK